MIELYIAYDQSTKNYSVTLKYNDQTIIDLSTDNMDQILQLSNMLKKVFDIFYNTKYGEV